MSAPAACIGFKTMSFHEHMLYSALLQHSRTREGATLEVILEALKPKSVHEMVSNFQHPVQTMEELKTLAAVFVNAGWISVSNTVGTMTYHISDAQLTNANGTAYQYPPVSRMSCLKEVNELLNDIIIQSILQLDGREDARKFHSIDAICWEAALPKEIVIAQLQFLSDIGVRPLVEDGVSEIMYFSISSLTLNEEEYYWGLTCHPKYKPDSNDTNSLSGACAVM
jgi:hypothetical protein